MPHVNGFSESLRMVHCSTGEVLSIGDSNFHLVVEREENSDPLDDENEFAYISLRRDDPDVDAMAGRDEFRARIPLAAIDQFFELFTRGLANARTHGTIPPLAERAQSGGQR